MGETQLQCVYIRVTKGSSEIYVGSTNNLERRQREHKKKLGCGVCLIPLLFEFCTTKEIRRLEQDAIERYQPTQNKMSPIATKPAPKPVVRPIRYQRIEEENWVQCQQCWAVSKNDLWYHTKYSCANLFYE